MAEALQVNQVERILIFKVIITIDHYRHFTRWCFPEINCHQKVQNISLMLISVTESVFDDDNVGIKWLGFCRICFIPNLQIVMIFRVMIK